MEKEPNIEHIATPMYADLELVHEYDDLLPPSVGLRQDAFKQEAYTTHKIYLVKKDEPSVQLGRMVLQEVYSSAQWYGYMNSHDIDALWIDRYDLVSLTPNKGIGTALWNISHRLIKPQSYRTIIDTSKNGWSERRIQKAVEEGVFEIVDQDFINNYGESRKRILVKYL